MSATEASNDHVLPLVRVAGGPRERGRQYGEQAAARIHRSRDAYERVYRHYARWSWSTARERSRAFVAPIDEFGPQYLEEMRGIADGAGLDMEDVLAMNLRTEILFAAKAANAAASLPRVPECTSLSVLGRDGSRIVAQNWDWLTFAAETVVVLECESESGPSWVTIVEAGLLGKFGLNSAGVALATNALVCSLDVGSPGVPYHVMLRSLLESTSLVDAMDRLQLKRRASSANYMIADGDGLALDAECRPGGFADIAWGLPESDGTLIHANHFSVERLSSLGVADVGLVSMPDTLLRYQSAQRRLRSDATGGRDGREVLSDHAGRPDSICCHPHVGSIPEEAWMTVAGVVIDPARRRFDYCVGNPCAGVWSSHDYTNRWR